MHGTPSEKMMMKLTQEEAKQLGDEAKYFESGSIYPCLTPEEVKWAHE